MKTPVESKPNVAKILSLGNFEFKDLLKIFLNKKKDTPHGGKFAQATLDFYRESPQDIIGFVAVINDEPVGFVAARMIKSKASNIILIVLPAFRDKGIGAALGKKLSPYIDSREELTIGIDNIPAIRIAIKSGLKPTGAKQVPISKNTKLSQTLVFS